VLFAVDAVEVRLPLLDADLARLEFDASTSANDDQPANLPMATIAAIGIAILGRMMIEGFPESSADRVTVTAPHPGAAREEVESSICVRIEEAIWDVDGIEQITSVASAGVGVIAVEMRTDARTRDVLDDVKVRAAAAAAGEARFRPILLTSLATFVGLTPLMMERSLQAKFLIPMAISLAFGVLFATVISLVRVPAAYGVLDDRARLARWFFPVRGGAPATDGARTWPNSAPGVGGGRILRFSRGRRGEPGWRRPAGTLFLDRRLAGARGRA